MIICKKCNSDRTYVRNNTIICTMCGFKYKVKKLNILNILLIITCILAIISFIFKFIFIYKGQ